MSKKGLLIISVIVIAAFTMVSCSSSGSGIPSESENGKIKIVASIFPLYDWAKNLAGDDADVQLLMTNGVDMHSFQPTVDDIITLTDCDIFIFVGGKSDSWVHDALSNTTRKDLTVINLMELLEGSVKTEETVQGMQEDPDEDEDEEYDEHIWLSLRNAAASCEEICSALCDADPENTDKYTARLKEYCAELNSLDREYSGILSGSKRNTVLFGDRFPFRYLTDDYGIHYYAAFAGCSAESEASFDTIIFLANKVDELSIHSILKIETSDGSIAETIRNNTENKDQEILTMNSMQSCTYEDVQNGLTYIGIMKNNLDTLVKALS